MPDPLDPNATGADCQTPAQEHFLPIGKAKLMAMLLEDQELDLQSHGDFERLGGMLEHWFHHQFQATQERMKAAFAHFDEEVSARWGGSTPEQKHAASLALAKELDTLLTQANYRRITFEELDPVHLRESIQKIALRVHLEDFDELVIYRRGLTTCMETIPYFFGLRKREVEVPGFDRVCFFLRFKDAAYFSAQKRKDLPFVPGSISLKLFRNIPRVDVGTLFPNAEVRMRMTDRLMVGVPAAAGVIHFLFFKVGLAALASLGAALLFVTSLSDDEPDTKKLVTAALTLGVFGGFLLRKYNQFRNRKIFFLKVLSENLYFRNLDNDSGVFLHLLDAAEDAEVKEALLAYAFLCTSTQPLLESELDQRVEAWLDSKLGKPVDFEVEDALKKLVDLELVQVDQEGRYQAQSIRIGIERFCSRWDALFSRQPVPAES